MSKTKGNGKGKQRKLNLSVIGMALLYVLSAILGIVSGFLSSVMKWK